MKYTIENLTGDLSEYLYNQQKAKIFNLLESQIENGQRLKACKSLAQDIIDNGNQLLKQHLNNIIKDWDAEIDVGCETCKSNGLCCWSSCKDKDYTFWKLNLNILHK